MQAPSRFGLLSNHRWAGSVRFLSLVAVLTGIFTLYGEPDFLVQLANQMWSCF
ncbi:MAG: hypothetical protein K9J50_03575 [Sulfuritalea sp.]|nr:hypothetical protein [Sulfuritalea sp.]